MNVGDILHIKPTIDVAAGFARPEIMPCRVIFVHPAGRFYTVEFRSSVTGQTWRECFWFERPPQPTPFEPRFGVKRRKTA